MKPNRKEDLVRNEPSPCPECSEFANCESLCPRAEAWVGQDRVAPSSNMLLENGTRESMSLSDTGVDYLDYIIHGSINSPMSSRKNSTLRLTVNPVAEKDSDLSQIAWNEVKAMRLSEKVSRFIYSHYMLGRRIRDIAILEGISSSAVDQRHKQAKLSIRDRMNKTKDWRDTRDVMEFKSIKHYDMSALFFRHFYPRRVTANILAVHPSTVIKEIHKQINNIHYE